MRLNKFIAHVGGLSRREADQAIKAGRIMVNEARASLGMQVSEDDIIRFDGKALHSQPAYHYILLNKPIHYVCSRRKQGETPTIYSLLPPDMQRLKPVGRLDKDSSGLLLLTDDGDFAHQMTHPKFHKTKQYLVTLDAPLQPLHHQMINDHGVRLEDGPSQLQLEKLHDDAHQWRVTMHEGRNRQIRRTFAVLGYTVTRLHRVTFGPYALTDEKPGEFHSISML